MRGQPEGLCGRHRHAHAVRGLPCVAGITPKTPCRSLSTVTCQRFAAHYAPRQGPRGAGAGSVASSPSAATAVASGVAQRQAQGRVREAIPSSHHRLLSSLSPLPTLPLQPENRETRVGWKCALEAETPGFLARCFDVARAVQKATESEPTPPFPKGSPRFQRVREKSIEENPEMANSIATR